MPPGYDVWVATAGEAITHLSSGKVTEISLDHDLGTEETGYTVAKWIERAAYDGTIPRLVWHLHTANIKGRLDMAMALENADEFWDEHENRPL